MLAAIAFQGTILKLENQKSLGNPKLFSIDVIFFLVGYG
ncbi:hypothetical protein K710_0786 [Streptococcus iniae SF1]|nr:hypothetical protein K710_0786 [Streptococcus iniae SF1]ESR10646.1 hypothetical protein IUSA1_00630 [Streptococcus iniae IUSA1]